LASGTHVPSTAGLDDLPVDADALPLEARMTVPETPV
jgi:hypothetical protein